MKFKFFLFLITSFISTNIIIADESTKITDESTKNCSLKK